MTLNLFEPTRERELTYYDRCAIAFDEVEMRAVRVRVKLTILATPLYRSQNLRYPYYKEFYGYMQSFFQNIYVCESAIHYPEQFVYDYWNQHALIAQQIAVYIQKTTPGVDAVHRAIGAMALPQFSDLALEIAQSLTLTREAISGFVTQLPGVLVLSDGSTSYVQSFVLPINLMRFKFEVGTVFKVLIQSWTLPITEDGTSTGNPEVAAPYDTDNPNENAPAPSGDRAPGGEPYGATPPLQSPRPPELDPDDFSDAPPPGPPAGTIALQCWQWQAIPQQQAASLLVGCPAGSLAASAPDYSYIQNSVSLGVQNIRIRPDGFVSREDLESLFSPFDGGNNNLVAGSCGVNGSLYFGN